MDGVVADWTAGTAKLIGYRLDDPTARFPDNDWKKIREHVRLYKDLPLLPHANEMANLARRFRDELGWELVFLTAVPHKNDIHWAFWDKMKWAEKYFPDIPVHFGPFSKDKDQHCKPGDILVDDRTDNCENWEKAGGIAIKVKYNNYRQALSQVSEILEKKLALKRLRDYENKSDKKFD